jgi:hypothetical protein
MIFQPCNSIPSDETELSSKKKIRDWKVIQPKLLAGADPGIWVEVLRDFYFDRLKTRYLDPIDAVRNQNKRNGEGFAIVAIQCSLIEFLESCYQGTNYDHDDAIHWRCFEWLKSFRPGGNSKKTARKYTYKNSRKMCISFLTERAPFKSRFNGALAKDFYRSVRCGVLHEARTKGAWRILAESGSSIIVDPDGRDGPILYRDDFQDGICKFIDDYRAAVPKKCLLQEAFIRKFEHLCI